MNKKLFVGRLPFGFSDEQLRTLFLKAGTVTSAVMVPDLKNGRTRGFGFVDMGSAEEAQNAIQALNGTPLEEKKIWVTLAREKGDAPKGRPAAFQGPPHEGAPRHSGGPPRRFGGQRRSFARPDSGYSASPTDRPKRHFTEGGASGRPARAPFRGKSSPTGGPAAGAAPSRTPFRGGQRRAFHSAEGRPAFGASRPGRPAFGNRSAGPTAGAAKKSAEGPCGQIWAKF